MTQAMLMSKHEHETERFYDAFTKLELQATREIEVSARELFRACVDVREGDPDDPDREQLLKEVIQKRKIFLASVREEFDSDNLPVRRS